MSRPIQLLIILVFCNLSYAQFFPINITVSQDKSGNYEKIQDAIDAAPENSKHRFYIKIRAGLYRESVYIGKEKTFITLVGEGMERTKIIGNLTTYTGVGLLNTSTLIILGQDFVAKDILIENEAGPKERAVALYSEVQSAFYRCGIKGYQDTLYARAGRQFYRDCLISGTIDFIFGNAEVVFQRCNIIVRQPLPGQFNVITAQGRDVGYKKGGTVIHNCKISADRDLKQSEVKTYLGRPWRIRATVVVMRSVIGGLIDPAGWARWNASLPVDQLFYAEYQNNGTGAAVDRRVKWRGYKVLKHAREATPFTVRNFINGSEWLPPTKIPFDIDL